MNSLVIVGAGGLAKQLLPQIIRLTHSNKAFYDSGVVDIKLMNYFPVLSNENELLAWLKRNDAVQSFDFLLAIGKPNLRKYFFSNLTLNKGKCLGLTDLTSQDTLFTEVEDSAMLMPEVYLESFVKIGRGTLVNVRAQIHHEVEIGDFCEIGPGAILLGGVKIGHETFIGAQATVLPGIILGNNVTIGAGAIVTKNFPDNVKIAGNPAKIIH